MGSYICPDILICLVSYPPTKHNQKLIRLLSELSHVSGSIKVNRWKILDTHSLGSGFRVALLPR